MIYAIDIDGVLCNKEPEADYENRTPSWDVIAKVNCLHEAGHTIKIFTGRGSKSGIDWREFTERQLKSWGVKYDELIMGKPEADLFIDDKAINVEDWMTEVMKEVEKVWGSELWVVNCEYCGKLLYLDKGAKSSYHRHEIKKETFFCIEGEVALTIEGKEYKLLPLYQPITIKPGQLHSFRGITDATIIEFSTHHDDRDVVRLTESRAAKNGMDKQG